LFPELGSHGGSTAVGRTDVGEDGSFHFPFVPEGSYTLVVTGARQVTHDQVPMDLTKLPPGVAFFTGPGITPMHSVDTTQQAYATATQPILVHSDMAGLQVLVSVKPAKVAAQ